MDTITIQTDPKHGTTAVPNLFIDRYMPSASGAYVKVYLYLLRCMSGSGAAFTLSAAAEQLDETEKDILRALSYWEKTHILSLSKEENRITGITLLELSAAEQTPAPGAAPVAGQTPAPGAAPVAGQTQTPGAAPVVGQTQTPGAAPVVGQTQTPGRASAAEADTAQPSRQFYTQQQIAELMKKEDISWLMNIIEVYLERLLTPQDINLVLYLYESLGFSKELILHLYEYCINKNKKKSEYIEAVALSWHKDGIDTIEKADQFSIQYDTCFNAVNRAFSLGRLPGARERHYIKHWSSLSLPAELIEEACNRTLLQIGKPDFRYANKIIDDWYQGGIRTLQEVADADKAHSAQASEKQPSKKEPASSNSRTGNPAPMTKSAGAYNSYPQRQYSEKELLEIERRLLAR